MKGILNNYIKARKRTRQRQARTLVALFLLSAVVASSVIWCLRFVGTALSATPVYEATPQVVRRTSPGWRDDTLPLTPPPRQASAALPAAKTDAPAAKAAPAAAAPKAADGGMSAQGGSVGWVNHALNLRYTLSNSFHDLGQLTDGVTGPDPSWYGSMEPYSYYEGTYVGSPLGEDRTLTFEISLNGIKTINWIDVHYFYNHGQNQNIGAPVKLKVSFFDGGNPVEHETVAPTEVSKFSKISISGLARSASKVKVEITGEADYGYLCISEIELWEEVVQHSSDPMYKVEYYGYYDKILISSNSLTAPERPEYENMGTENIMLQNSSYTYSKWNGEDYNKPDATNDDDQATYGGFYDLNDGIYCNSLDFDDSKWVCFNLAKEDSNWYVQWITQTNAAGHYIKGCYIEFLVDIEKNIPKPSFWLYVGSTAPTYKAMKTVMLRGDETKGIGAAYCYFDANEVKWIEGNEKHVTVEIGVPKTTPENQRWAYISEFAVLAGTPWQKGAKVLDVIDTRQHYGYTLYGGDNYTGCLPKNAGEAGYDSDAPSYYVSAVQLMGDTNRSVLNTEKTLTRIYREHWYYQSQAPNVRNINKLAQNDDWILSGIQVSDNNGTSWTEYKNQGIDSYSIGTADSDITVKENTIIRLVYEPVPGTYLHKDTHFFDYDITDGTKNSNGEYGTWAYGINSKYVNENSGGYLQESYVKAGNANGYPLGNYSASNQYTGSTSPINPCDLAFGNANTGTAYGFMWWYDPVSECWAFPNKANSGQYRSSGTGNFTPYKNNNYPGSAYGFTFKLVKPYLLPEPGANATNEEISAYAKNSGLQFGDNLQVNPWFRRWGNEHDFTTYGKRYFTNMPLDFVKMGSSHTLRSVGWTYSGNITDRTAMAEKLDGFLETHPDAPLYSNEFWPMDTAIDSSSTPGASAFAAKDLPFGGATNQPQLHYYACSYFNNRKTGTTAFPGSDYKSGPTGGNHNSYFGLNFEITFNLSKDYIGPLEYFFFGDDDMWVFLDGKLVCDIGGVHSSVGEYVNLWDTLSPYNTGTHRLTVFYTERGASGSSCYMRFILPDVSEPPMIAGTGGLTLSVDVDENIPSETPFTYEIELLNADGSPYTESKDVYFYGSYVSYYSVSTQSESSQSPFAGGKATITLLPGQLAEIRNLPAGVKFNIKQVTHEGYTVTAFSDRLVLENGLTAPATSADLGNDYTCHSIDGDNGTNILAANTSRVHFFNKALGGPELPSTGGVGREVLPVLGLTAVIFSSLAPVVLRDKSNRKQRRAK